MCVLHSGFLRDLAIDKSQRVSTTGNVEDALKRVGRACRFNQQKHRTLGMEVLKQERYRLIQFQYQMSVVAFFENVNACVGAVVTRYSSYLAIRTLLVLVLVSETLPSFA